jgi:predicted glycosyltransferase
LVEEYGDCFESEDAGLWLGSWEAYRDLAASAACSVSQCSYNTAYELLYWQVPAIFMPRPHDGPDPSAEGEHEVRARKIADRSLGRIVTEPAALADAIVSCISGPRPVRPDLDFSGAKTTARIFVEL